MSDPLHSDPCVDALREMYAARGQAAVDAIAPFLTDDFEFVPAGTARSALQDTYRGAAGFAAFLRRQADWTQDTWWPRLDELLIGRRWLIAVVTAEPTRSDGLRADFRIVHRWQRRAEQLCAFRSFSDQQDGYDAFHSD